MSARRHAGEGGYTPGAGLPLGPPFGHERESENSQVSESWSQSRRTNTPSPPGSVVRAGRVGARALERLDRHLTDRDRDILSRVAEHRYLTTRQIQHFSFDGHASEASASRSSRRVLTRLERDGLLRSLGRRVGGVRAGSSAMVWQLSAAGLRLLRRERTSYRTGEPSVRFLAHCLAVADVHLLLRDHQRIEAIESVRVEVEPASWRRYVGPGGERRWLQPDLYAEITTSDFVDRVFLEVDLGTESLPTLLGKCSQYEAYRASGVEQARTGGFPLVVWLLVSPPRADKLEAAVARGSRLTTAMYRFATPETLADVLAGGAA